MTTWKQHFVKDDCITMDHETAHVHISYYDTTRTAYINHNSNICRSY